MQVNDQIMSDQLHDQIMSDGFVVVDQLIPEAEVSRLRAGVVRHLAEVGRGVPQGGGRVEPLAAFNLDCAQDVVASEAVVEAARAVLGVDEPVFTFHCDAHLNLVSAWHKDSGEQVMPGGYFGRPIFDVPTCPVVKFAVYCQEHSEHDGAGLYVRSGSQHEPDYMKGHCTSLQTSPGDAVVFDVRLSHMGEPSNLVYRTSSRISRRLPGSMRDRASSSMRQLELRARRRPDKVALFFSFGVEDEWTRAFSRTNLERATKQAGGVRPPLPSPFVDRLQAAGAKLATGVPS